MICTVAASRGAFSLIDFLVCKIRKLFSLASYKWPSKTLDTVSPRQSLDPWQSMTTTRHTSLLQSNAAKNTRSFLAHPARIGLTKSISSCQVCQLSSHWTRHFILFFPDFPSCTHRQVWCLLCQFTPIVCAQNTISSCIRASPSLVLILSKSVPIYCINLIQLERTPLGCY